MSRNIWVKYYFEIYVVEYFTHRIYYSVDDSIKDLKVI